MRIMKIFYYYYYGAEYGFYEDADYYDYYYKGGSGQLGSDVDEDKDKDDYYYEYWDDNYNI